MLSFVSDLAREKMPYGILSIWLCSRFKLVILSWNSPGPKNKPRSLKAEWQSSKMSSHLLKETMQKNFVTMWCCWVVLSWRGFLAILKQSFLQCWTPPCLYNSSATVEWRSDDCNVILDEPGLRGCRCWSEYRADRCAASRVRWDFCTVQFLRVYNIKKY